MAYGTLDCVTKKLEALNPQPDPFPDPEEIQGWLDFATTLIDNYTGQWFEPRDIDEKLDGTGSPLLQLPINFIKLDTLEIYRVSGSYSSIFDTTQGKQVLDKAFTSDEYNLKSGKGLKDWRYLPSICLNLGIFPRGCDNVHLVGSAGFVENDGSTPAQINWAACQIAFYCFLKEQEAQDANNPNGGGQWGVGPKIREFTDGHEIEWSDAHVVAQNPDELLIGLFGGNAKLRQVLEFYRRPLTVTCP